MKQLHEALQTEDAKRALLILEDPEGIAPSVRFETFTVWVNGEPYIGFYDKIWVGKLQGGDVLQIDCTFASRMKIDGLRQLLTVMVRTFDKAFAAVWVNMPTKLEIAYKPVLHEIKRILNIKPRQILVDFELAEQNALKEVFPDATITSCFFHWTQAIWTNALKRKVAYPGMSKEEPEKFEFIRMIMALALLPEEFIVPTYKIIKERAKEKFGNFFADFCKEYIEGYWINQRKPKTFSVYGQLLKTNNDQESYHRILNGRFRHVRPAVKNFHNRMLRYAQLQYIVLDGLKEGLTSQPRNPVSAFNEKLLLENWKKIPQALSPIDFVTKMANEMKRFVKFIEEDVDPENVNDEDEAAEAEKNKETEKNPESPGNVSDDDIVEADICESSMTDEELSKMIHTLDQDVMNSRGEEPDQAKQQDEPEKSGNGPTNEGIISVSEPSPGKLSDGSNLLTPKKPRKSRKRVRGTSSQTEKHSNTFESTIEEALSISKSVISKELAISRKRACPAPVHAQTYVWLQKILNTRYSSIRFTSRP
ncbi:hypothetical protein QAD02_020796 [Eretmocerus hayati]|uniref:Uncharacterized protein n=1 Tax=Eretmocerus hayati TaxID=131215 RepID=A0ACC2PPR3_9HYME|nr:hypothetical protein QAD02_020796 [Eretmocerus hayati]